MKCKLSGFHVLKVADFLAGNEIKGKKNSQTTTYNSRNYNSTTVVLVVSYREQVTSTTETGKETGLGLQTIPHKQYSFHRNPPSTQLYLVQNNLETTTWKQTAKT